MIQLLIQHTADRHRCTVIPCRCLNTASAAGCMYDTAISNVNRYMVYFSVASCIEDQISRFHSSGGDFLTHLCLGAGIMWKGYTKFLHNPHSKSGAVNTIGQTGSAPYIAVSYKLKSVVYKL